MMLTLGSNCSSVHTTSTYSTLLRELQQLWTEIGETEADKDNMLLELEQECLNIYRRKVDEVANAKTRLHQSIVAKEAELAILVAALGENINVNSPVQSEKKAKSLKGQLASVTPLVEDLKLKKEERLKQFSDIKLQVDKITAEISGCANVISGVSSLNSEEQDLSVRKLMEYQSNLHALKKEKSQRLKKVMDYVNEVHTLSTVLNLDFGKIVNDVHPSLHGSNLEHVTNISDVTLEGLSQAILRLKTERKFRFQKLKDVAKSLLELWNLMDTSKEEKLNFLKVMSILDLPESEISQPGSLSLEIIEQVSAEVERFTKLKTNRLKELVMKRRSELDDICCKAHIEPDPSTAADKSNALIESGLVDPSELLANIEAQIFKAKDEVLSRRDIMEKIDRWLSACNEENWLEDYNKDDNRYSAGRGVHINLKRAERARITVNKIPAIVDNLISRTLAWEHVKQKLFLYDGVRLVSILEGYKESRYQKEEEKKRARDKKKLQDMLLAEKESIYGSKPSPRSSSFRKPNGYGNGSVTPSPRRNSLGSSYGEPCTPHSSYSERQNGYFKDMRRLSTAPLNFVAIQKEEAMNFVAIQKEETMNFVAIQKEETMSFSSIGGSEPESPPQV